MAVVHSGTAPAKIPDYMNPNDEEVFWMSWTDALGGESITSSAWFLPDGFTEEATTQDGSVTESGVTYDDANSIRVSTTNNAGSFRISNEVTTSGSRTFRRSIIVIVEPCI